ncbi:MAG: protein phosphatase 2C domain-containing protein [Dokdonella sp.]
MLRVRYAMRRSPHHGQQDCMLIGNKIRQEANQPPRSVGMSASNTIFAVADGVSSSPHASLASAYALEALRKIQQQRDADGVTDLVDGRVIRKIHAELCRRMADHPATRGSATTIAIAHIIDNRLRVLNVGDSRVWLRRARSVAIGDTWLCMRRAGGEVSMLSKDHTVLQGLIDRGEASADVEYASFYQALEHALVADHDADDFAIHSSTVDIDVGDEIILCTDGVANALTHGDMEAALHDCKVTDNLGSLCNAITTHGLVDDYSIIWIEVTR